MDHTVAVCAQDNQIFKPCSSSSTFGKWNLVMALSETVAPIPVLYNEVKAACLASQCAIAFAPPLCFTFCDDFLISFPGSMYSSKDATF